ncbi:MAG: aminotransferase class I/II-fold pyridoxal phosphate-dependent enzyme [Alphaproteobacteria bacterium]|nr:aminotransferase class I/II-fold pyridoxal phosphate-dependent enzyme [Alphaproteobacteria bacterium]
MTTPIFPGRLSLLPSSPFARLAELLKPIPPGGAPINLSVGDPKGQVPDFIREVIAQNAHRFGEYPPIQGIQEWREAAVGWLRRRFGLPVAAIGEQHVLPLNGTREGLFLVPFIVTPERKNGERPAILLPNPFYQAYAAAILAAGAEPIFVTADAQSGFLPAFSRLPQTVLRRTVGCYICSPSNPEGATADRAYWQVLFDLADRFDFSIFADECYADIYWGTRPPGALAVRHELSGGFERLLTFHSLSKRSALPGLRSGIVAGDPALISTFMAWRNYSGPQVPIPLQMASAAAWSDEAHVDDNRALYAARFAAARRILGNRARIPDAGFFLWLPTGDGEAAAVRLWREAGIRVVPGAYMGRPADATDPASNPGFPYIRVALVSDLSTIEAAIGQIGEILFTPGA